jgi:hypothetical protein
MVARAPSLPPRRAILALLLDRPHKRRQRIVQRHLTPLQLRTQRRATQNAQPHTREMEGLCPSMVPASASNPVREGGSNYPADGQGQGGAARQLSGGVTEAAQAQRHHRRAQLGSAADVAAPLVEGDADLKPVVTHWVSSRIVPRTEAVHRMPVACGAGCKARTRTDEGAILRWPFQAGGIT